jgi:hypothetical protein
LPVPGEQGGQTTAPAPEAPAQTGWLDKVGVIVATIFGTNLKRGQRLSSGQVVARTVARSVGSEVARGVSKSLGGGTSGRVTGQIIRNTLGGVLRR